jgi:hypothetical protein
MGERVGCVMLLETLRRLKKQGRPRPCGGLAGENTPAPGRYNRGGNLALLGAGRRFSALKTCYP